MPLSRKVAFINLSTQEIEAKSIPIEVRKKFLGGRGVNMHFFLTMVKKGIDPFDAENPLIFGAGLLTGLFGKFSGMFASQVAKNEQIGKGIPAQAVSSMQTGRAFPAGK